MPTISSPTLPAPPPATNEAKIRILEKRVDLLEHLVNGLIDALKKYCEGAPRK